MAQCISTVRGRGRQQLIGQCVGKGVTIGALTEDGRELLLLLDTRLSELPFRAWAALALLLILLAEADTGTGTIRGAAF